MFLELGSRPPKHGDAAFAKVLDRCCLRRIQIACRNNPSAAALQSEQQHHCFGLQVNSCADGFSGERAGRSEFFLN